MSSRNMRRVLWVVSISSTTALMSLWLTSPATADFRDEVLADNPFLYYEFNDTSGITATDSSGNGNNGEYVGGVTFGAAGPAGMAVMLDGSSGFVETPPTGIVTDIWTVEFILRADTLSDSGFTSLFSTLDYPTVPDNGAGEGGALHFNLEDEGNLLLIDAPNSGETEAEFEFPVDTGLFAHVVATSDNAGTFTRRIYVNGELALENLELEGGGPTSFDGFANIGAWNDDRFLGGVVDEFAIYDKVLTEDDVLRHFAASPLAPAVSLTVNQDDGSVVLTNISGQEFAIAGYSITSAVGALAPQSWNSIDGRDAGGDGSVDPDSDWTITDETEFVLAESAEDGTGVTLAADASIELGEGVWRPFFEKEVGIAGTDAAGESFFGIVTYEGDDILFADLDVDGDVDPADWDEFVAGYGSELSGLTPYEAYFSADLDGDGEHTSNDFIEFVVAFDDVNGASAFASTVGGSVPEPSTVALIMLCAAVSLVRRFRPGWRHLAFVLAIAAASVLAAVPAQAELLVEYTFENGFQDSSGNGRTGVPVGLLGGEPTVMNGRADFSGIPLSWLEVPLGAANPFDGSQDFTVEMTFNTLGANFAGGGVILLGSADTTEPTEPDNHSMSIFVEPHEEEDGDVFGGALVYDNFFVGEVRVPDATLLDGEDHMITITYVAPEDLGDPEDPEPGRLFINLDGQWVARGEIAPNIPNIANHTVTLGSTLNEDFPFECAEGECLTQEFTGTMDNVRVFNEAMPPTELRAVVDRSTGEITLMGGEFADEIRFYEVRSEAGSLNPAGWNSLSDQDTDSLGGNSGESWDELAAASDRLTEGFLLGSSLFDENRALSLGNSYNTSVDAQDLEFEILNTDLDPMLLAIEYVGEPPVGGVDGDYNDNGRVEQADLDLVLLNWGQSFDTLPDDWINERPTEGIVDQAELDGVLLNWGNTAGPAAASVPEPASLILIGLVAIIAGLRGLRRRR